MNSILTEIENSEGIALPTLYKDLYEKGMLDWKETGVSWYESTFPKLKENPPLLLFAEDIEIWNPDISKNGMLEVLHREVYDIAEGYKFMPLAKNGAGDLYVFQFDLQQDGNVPITFVPHDDCEAIVLAKNLQDFIFRQLLEVVRDIYEDCMVYEEDQEVLRDNLVKQLTTHKPFLTTHQVSILEEIYSRDLFDYVYTIPHGSSTDCQGLVTYDEVEQILKNEIGFVHLDKVFDYTAL